MDISIFGGMESGMVILHVEYSLQQEMAAHCPLWQKPGALNGRILNQQEWEITSLASSDG